MTRKPNDDELKLLNNCYCPDGGVGVDDVHIMESESASTKVQTAYFSYLSDESIRNFAMDINGKVLSKGNATIGFYLNHDTSSRPPMGGCFDAEVVESDGKLTVRHKIFLPTNYTAGDINVDDYVKSVRFRMSEDVSVGFRANKMTCDLCQNDIRSLKCSHYPGGRYNIGTEEEPKMAVCTFTIGDAHLLEVSAAWKGALPGAKIVMSDNGDADGTTIAMQTGVNIKSFPEDATLKFNCSGHGSIELCLDPIDGGKLVAKEKDVSEVEVLTDSGGGIDVELAQDVQDDSTFAEVVEEIESAVDEIEPAFNEYLDELSNRIDMLECKLSDSQTIIDSFIGDLKSEIHKLSVGVDSTLYVKEDVDMIVDKLSVEELKKYRESMQAKLAAKIPTGRRCVDGAESEVAGLEQYIDKSVYRVGR